MSSFMHNGPGPAYVHGTIKPYENIYPEPHNIFTMGCLILAMYSWQGSTGTQHKLFAENVFTLMRLEVSNQK